MYVKIIRLELDVSGFCGDDKSLRSGQDIYTIDIDALDHSVGADFNDLVRGGNFVAIQLDLIEGTYDLVVQGYRGVEPA